MKMSGWKATVPRRVFGVLLLVSAVQVDIFAATLTLQEGTTGYGGCADSFIQEGYFHDGWYDNFGSSPTLILNTEGYG